MQPVHYDGSCVSHEEGQPAGQQQEGGRVCPFPGSSSAARHGNTKAAQPVGEAFDKEGPRTCETSLRVPS